MAVLDSTIANVALPTFVHVFMITPATTVWLVNAFQLTVVATLLPFSAIADRIGYRRIYQSGLTIFTAGSLACACAHTFPELVAARILQGVGAGGILSIGPALYRIIFPQALLGRGIGISALVVATSSALGPSLGGAILSVLPWPWIFAVNVPVGIVASIAAFIALPDSIRRPKLLDVPSMIAGAAGLSLLVFGADEAARHARTDIAAGTAASGALILLAFTLRQRLIPNPLVEPRLFAAPRFTLAAATSLVSFIAQGTALISLPFLIRADLAATPLHIGMLLSTWPLTIAVTGPLAGRLSDRFPAPVLSTIGLTVLAAGLVLQGTLDAHNSSALQIAWRSVVCGCGFGFFQPPNNRELLGNAPRELAGNASGILATVRVLGQTCGAAIAAMFLAGGNMARGSHGALLTAAAIAAAAALVSATRLSYYRRSASFR